MDTKNYISIQEFYSGKSVFITGGNQKFKYGKNC